MHDAPARARIGGNSRSAFRLHAGVRDHGRARRAPVGSGGFTGSILRTRRAASLSRSGGRAARGGLFGGRGAADDV